MCKTIILLHNFWMEALHLKLDTANQIQVWKNIFFSQTTWRGEYFLCITSLSDTLPHIINCILCTLPCPRFSVSPCSAYGFQRNRGVLLVGKVIIPLKDPGIPAPLLLAAALPQGNIWNGRSLVSFNPININRTLKLLWKRENSHTSSL